ncbi:MAG: secretin and TonB N-terminal domain-containing protein [Rubrivivax sp.]
MLLATALGATVVITMSGCAAQKHYRAGLALTAANQPEAALDRLRAASEAAPENTEYRTAYLLARQRLVASVLEQADRAVADSQPERAQNLFLRVLAIDPVNRPAKAGLDSLQRQAAHARSLDEAEEHYAQRRTDAARVVVMSVLDADPRHARARALLRQIEARQEPAAVELRLGAPFRQPVSLEFRDATVKQVFDALSRTSGLNFVFDKDVKTDQKTALTLRNSTVEAALQMLLVSNQLEMQVMDAGTVMVFPNTAAKLREYQQLVVKTFVLSSANAKAVVELIKTMVRSRDIVYDEKLNMVFMRDTVEAVRLAERLVALHDVAEPEVMLEVEILEISRDRLTELGIAWPGSLTLTPLISPDSTIDTLTLRDLRSLRSETVGARIDALRINARKVDGDSNLLANPRIRVLNRDKARIVIGNRIPSVSTTVTATGLATESVSYLDVGLKLEVEPTIFVNGDVAIKVALEVSNVISSQTTNAGSSTYNIGTRSATTTLRLKDGENQVLAGLINDEDRRAASKVPALGELPVAGRLFGSTLSDGRKSEIVLSITPRLIRNIQRPPAGEAEFFSGTDSSARTRPAAGQPARALGDPERVPPSGPAAAGATGSPVAPATAPAPAGAAPPTR